MDEDAWSVISSVLQTAKRCVQGSSGRQGTNAEDQIGAKVVCSEALLQLGLSLLEERRIVRRRLAEANDEAGFQMAIFADSTEAATTYRRLSRRWRPVKSQTIAGKGPKEERTLLPCCERNDLPSRPSLSPPSVGAAPLRCRGLPSTQLQDSVADALASVEHVGLAKGDEDPSLSHLIASLSRLPQWSSALSQRPMAKAKSRRLMQNVFHPRLLRLRPLPTLAASIYRVRCRPQ